MGSPNRCEVVVLRCQGRIVLGHETRLLCAAIRQQGRNVMLDLSEVDAIDAAGIGALVSLQAAGVYLRLMNPAKQVLETLRVTRLDSVFEICEAPSADKLLEGSAVGDRCGPVSAAC